jgi:hypothetical protein
MVDVVNDATERLYVTPTRLPGHCRAGHSWCQPNRLCLLVRQLSLAARVGITMPAFISPPVTSTNATIRTPHRPDWTILRVIVRLVVRASRRRH